MLRVGDLVKCKGDSPFLPGVGIVIKTEVSFPRPTVYWFDEHTAWRVSSSELEILTEK